MNKSPTRSSRSAPAMAPRNPLVAAARFRQAGAHGGGRKRERQRAQGELAAALRTLKESL
jgi:hypothetical protein